VNQLAVPSAWQVNVARERVPDLGIAFACVAVAVRPTGIVIAVSSLRVRPLPVVSRTASERPRVAIIAVTRPSIGLSPVVIALLVAGAAAGSATRCVRVPLVVSRVVITRVKIEHAASQRE
jgi:hypothetical protein